MATLLFYVRLCSCWTTPYRWTSSAAGQFCSAFVPLDYSLALFTGVSPCQTLELIIVRCSLWLSAAMRCSFQFSASALSSSVAWVTPQFVFASIFSPVSFPSVSVFSLRIIGWEGGAEMLGTKMVGCCDFAESLKKAKIVFWLGVIRYY